MLYFTFTYRFEKWQKRVEKEGEDHQMEEKKKDVDDNDDDDGL